MGLIIGYADPLVVSPGETVSLHVSSTSSSYTSRVLRLGPGLDHPKAPTVNHTPVTEIDSRHHQGREQYTRPGSYILVDQWPGSKFSEVDELVIEFWCHPSLPVCSSHQQYLFSTLNKQHLNGVACFLDTKGNLNAIVANSQQSQIFNFGSCLNRYRWYHLSFHIHKDHLKLETISKGDGITEKTTSNTTTHSFSHSMSITPGQLLIIGSHLDVRASTKVTPSASFNGKLQDFSFKALEHGSTHTFTDFDFAQEITKDVVNDRFGSCGVLINAPARAVTGHDWHAGNVDWTKSSSGYGAIAFHDDDIDDAAWEVDFEVTVPASLRSGCYGVQLDNGEHIDIVPFFVRPDYEKEAPSVAIIMPTFTYNAYANERLFDSTRDVHMPMGTSSLHIDKNLKGVIDRPDLGISLYDSHNDGSGTVFSSTKRVVLNMRPDYFHWGFGGPRELAADLWFIGFLDREVGAMNYDVITDHDVNTKGESLLCRYKVLLSGSHPEYPTFFMLDAYSAFLSNGGFFMYLGGNGYYWVTAHDPHRTHRIEVRRGDQGCRVFGLPPGEWHHSMTGERGGLWRSRGRPSNLLFGLGSCACGMGTGAPYGLASSARRNSKIRFLLEGIEDDIIGDFGLVQGAASGDEIDRFDITLGSPGNAIMIASSKFAGGHSDDYGLFNEDSMFPMVNTLGSNSDKVRSDLIYFETAAGGAVFSVGSINWVGALAWENYQNSVAKITSNALHMFLERSHRARS